MSRTRKLWLVVGIAAVLMLASASAAIADTGSSGYQAWSTGLPGNLGSTSPHGGYSTTTVKCAVCHAVHNAGIFNAGSSGGAAEILLQTNVADACEYCHMNLASGYSQVYGGVASNYNGGDVSNAHNWYEVSPGVWSGVTCNKCHQVHAANQAMTLNPYLTQKLLRGSKTTSALDPKYDELAGAPTALDSPDTALTKWCTSCHATSIPTPYTYYNNEYNTGAAQSHIMTAAPAAYGNTSGSYNGKVAWLDSNQCSSCHADGYGTSAWPHFTPGVRFLVTAANSTAATAAATAGSVDGICTRCHRTAGGSGIGIDF